jgi:hypothetical protein
MMMMSRWWWLPRKAAFPAQLLVNMAENDEALSAEHAYSRVAAEVFILGYPNGLTKQASLPV